MNLPLPNADHMIGLVFLLMIGLTLFGGLVACNANRLVRAVAGLVVSFVGVAGLYYFLNSPFIAMMQMLIYVGAVAVTISFAIMFAAPEESKKHGPPGMLSGPLGVITAGLVFGGFTLLALKTDFQVHEKINNGSVESMGQMLLTSYSMVFELISIVLLIAIIGALVIARRGRSS